MSLVAQSITQSYRSNLANAKVSQSVHLPKIVHSAARVGDPLSLNITARAVSRASSLGDIADKLREDLNGRPLPFEFNEDKSQNKKKSTKSMLSTHRYSNYVRNDVDYVIPDGIKTVYSPDLAKPSIPVFGNKPDTVNQIRSAPPTPLKIEIDEIVLSLKDRVRAAYHEIKIKFKNADVDGKGNVSKDALAHIVAAILGPAKPLSHNQFQKIMDRLGFKNKALIKFEEFVACFQESKQENSEWVDPVRNTQNANALLPVQRKATQVFVILKEKAKQKSKDITSLLPQLIGGNPSRIFKPELHNTINLMNIKMDADEFDKLWKKFDTENIGVVHSDAFIKKLGVLDNSSDNHKNESPRLRNSIDDPNSSATDVPLPEINDKKSMSRSTSKNPIEKWLKRRFREGFVQLKASFDEIDISRTGSVRKEQFLNVLRKHGLKLESHYLEAFLERCDIDCKSTSLVPYTKFLEKFQNRSEQGLTYKVITGEQTSSRAESALGQIQRKLLKMFQKDFLSLLTIFRKLDRNRSNTISKQEFRAVLESHFAIELSDSEFQEFCLDLPIEDQRVKYLDFMTRFDSDDSNSLFDAQSVRSASPPGYSFAKKRDHEIIQEEIEESPRDKAAPAVIREVKELSSIIKDYIRNHYKEVETKWSEIDSQNTGQMTLEMFWELLKSLKIASKFSREDLDVLWKTFLLKDNNTLDYWQFVRHFGYTKKSAAYQNAKRAPPKRGDCDMMLTSNKLGRDSILIRGSVHAKLRLQAELIKRSFHEIDPYHSGYVLRDEFKEVLLELCPELNEEELEMLCEKYENAFDTRINYMMFLQPYLRSKQGNLTSLPSSRQESNDPLVQKLRYKLSDRYKELRRMFKQRDFRQSGTISISAFKECMDTTKINLTDEEIYSVVQKLDSDMSGFVDYNKFLNEMIKP